MIEPCVIVGGGVAGAVAAISLAKAGAPPLLLERSRGAHHKVCGEFLSRETANRLRGIGLDLDSLGGSRIDRVRIIHGARCIEARLPGAAVGISRFALDEALLAHAARCGARIERGVGVQSIARNDGLFRVADIAARRVLLATGKANLRGLARDSRAQDVTSDLIGHKSHYRLRPLQAAALAGVVELHLLDGGGYAGLQLVENGIANLCLLSARPTIAGSLGAAAILGERLSGAEPLFERPLAIAGVPYGFLHRRTANDLAGLQRLGDQFAVVHSFTGSGMAIAAASGALAARRCGGDYHAAVARSVRWPVRLSSFLHAGLAKPRLRDAALAAASLQPGLVTIAARLTRIRH